MLNWELKVGLRLLIHNFASNEVPRNHKCQLMQVPNTPAWDIWVI